MPSGIQITTDKGISQIDNNYLNYMFKSKGTLKISETVANNKVTVTDSDDTHLLAIELSGGVQVACKREHSAGKTTYTLASSTIGTNITYYNFTIGDMTSTAKYGLDIYDKAGKLVFSTSKKPMSIISEFTDGRPLSKPEGTVTTNAKTLPASYSKVAIIVSNFSSSVLKRFDGSIGRLFLHFTDNFYSWNNSEKVIKKHSRTVGIAKVNTNTTRQYSAPKPSTYTIPSGLDPNRIYVSFSSGGMMGYTTSPWGDDAYIRGIIMTRRGRVISFDPIAVLKPGILNGWLDYTFQGAWHTNAMGTIGYTSVLIGYY